MSSHSHRSGGSPDGVGRGIGGVNAERQNSNDPMYSDFNNVEGSINGSWSSTDALGHPYETDPSFHIVYDTTHDIRFVHD